MGEKRIGNGGGGRQTKRKRKRSGTEGRVLVRVRRKIWVRERKLAADDFEGWAKWKELAEKEQDHPRKRSGERQWNRLRARDSGAFPGARLQDFPEEGVTARYPPLTQTYSSPFLRNRQLDTMDFIHVIRSLESHPRCNRYTRDW
jgi:hypothetical protein